MRLIFKMAEYMPQEERMYASPSGGAYKYYHFIYVNYGMPRVLRFEKL